MTAGPRGASDTGTGQSVRSRRFGYRPLLAAVGTAAVAVVFMMFGVELVVRGDYGRHWDLVQIADMAAKIVYLACVVWIVAWGAANLPRAAGWVALALSLPILGGWWLVEDVEPGPPKRMADYFLEATSSQRIADCDYSSVTSIAAHNAQLFSKDLSCQELEEHGFLCDGGGLWSLVSGYPTCEGGATDEGRPASNGPEPAFVLGFE